MDPPNDEPRTNRHTVMLPPTEDEQQEVPIPNIEEVTRPPHDEPGTCRETLLLPPCEDEQEEEDLHQSASLEHQHSVPIEEDDNGPPAKKRTTRKKSVGC